MRGVQKWVALALLSLAALYFQRHGARGSFRPFTPKIAGAAATAKKRPKPVAPALPPAPPVPPPTYSTKCISNCGANPAPSLTTLPDTASETATCSIELDVDIHGNDVAGIGVTVGRGAAGLGDCCRTCAVHETCTAFTFFEGTCWLKRRRYRNQKYKRDGKKGAASGFLQVRKKMQRMPWERNPNVKRYVPPDYAWLILAVPPVGAVLCWLAQVYLRESVGECGTGHGGASEDQMCS